MATIGDPLPAPDDPVAWPPVARGLDFFSIDRNLCRLLARRAPMLIAGHGDRLADFGAWVGGPVDIQAEYTDRHAPPRLETHDRRGVPDGRVVLNPAYEAAHAEAYRRGIVGLPFGPERAPHLLSFVMGYLLSQADISIHCPVTLTGAVAHVLDSVAPAGVRDAWLPELVRMDGRALTGATWATELHGGSDIGRTTTQAVPDGEGWRLTGLKWFASNAGSGVALATARPVGAEAGGRGLGCYLVPGHLPDGTRNAWRVRRLKEKVGTRGLPTGEIELDGAWAVEVAPPPRGLKAMMEALEYSRIHNAAGAAGLQRRAFVEAACWATHRTAFGAPIADYPMLRDELLDLVADQEASLALAMESAIAFDRERAGESGLAWLRAVTAIAKYRTAADAVTAASRAVELVGGNGYTEEWPTARLYRDALVTSVWEGPANIQALELIRSCLGELPGDEAFLSRIDRAVGGAEGELGDAAGTVLAARERCRDAFRLLRSDRSLAIRHARRLMALMADTLSAALLVEEAAAELAAGDRRKALIARRYAARRFGGADAIVAAPDPWLGHFAALAGHGRVRA